MTGTSAKRRRRLPAIVLAFTASVAAMCVGAVELPPEIQADRYLVQAERQLQAGDHDAAVATLDKIVALQQDHGLAIPPAFWFKQAQASHDTGAVRAGGQLGDTLPDGGRPAGTILHGRS